MGKNSGKIETIGKIGKSLVAGLLCAVTFAGSMSQVVWAKGTSQETEARQDGSATYETPSGLSAEAFEAYCDSYFTEKVKGEIPSASIAVVSNGKIVFEKGYGYSDIARSRLSDPTSTVYEYGSVSKLFTWISLMQLKEAGKIDLTGDISQYLPEDFEVPKSYDKPITVLDLMNHQAGFDDYLIHLFNQPDNMLPLREALEEHKVQQVCEPGTVSSYSNYGAGLAGYIVEQVAGKPEYAYVEEHVLKPSGMEHATLNPDIYASEYLLSNKAKVYEQSGDGFAEENWSLVSMYPAGAANGTVEELACFALALLDENNHPLFAKKETGQELLSTSYQGAPGVAGIAHGFIEYDGEYPTYWHNGGTDHSSTFFAVVPQVNFGIAICSNSGNIDPIQDFGFRMLDKRAVHLETPEQNLPQTKAVEGSYRTMQEDHRGITKLIFLPGHMFPIQVKAVDEQHIRIGGSTYLEIKPYLYQDVDTGEKISFTVQDGKVVKYSYLLEYLKMPQSSVYLAWGQAILLGLLALSILGSVVYMVVAGWKKSLRKRDLFLGCNAVGWSIYLVSLLVLVVRIEQWESFSAMQPQLYFNRILAAILLFDNVLGIVGNFAREEGWKKKGIGIVPYMLSILAVGVVGTLGGWSIYY